jgi:hypothetical protein
VTKCVVFRRRVSEDLRRITPGDKSMKQYGGQELDDWAQL